jgi:hypothetical protein
MENSIIRTIKFAVAKLEDYKEITTRHDYVSWGEKNDYPQKLISLFNDSGKHGAIVTGKASYIIGKGITSETDPELRNLKKANPVDDYEIFLKKLALDYELFGGYAYLVVPNLTKEKAAAYYHLDVSKIRTNAACDTFYFYPEWDKIGTGKPKEDKGLKVYERFDGVYDKPKVVWYSQYRPSIGTYPQPEYRQGLTAIETDARVSNFHLNNLRNGFFGSKMISLKGKFTPEQQDDFERRVTEKFASDENAGKFMLIFNDGEGSGAEVSDMTAGDFGEQFAQLRKDTEQEIFIAHKIPSPMIFGVRVEGQLGGRTELLEAWELFNNTYIEERRMHFENLLNDLVELKGGADKYELLPFAPIKSEMSETLIRENLDKNEIRELYGFEKVETQPAPAQAQEFSSVDAKEVEVFMKYGSDKGKFKRLNAVQIRHLSNVDMDTFHQSFNDIQKDQNISEDEKRILNQINEGKQPKIEAKTEEKLKQKKLIETDRESGAYKLTQLGGLILTELQPERQLAKLRTVYEYVKRPDASGGDILPNGRTRPFCEALIKSNKYFSREDINSISTELGYDVWTYRGGWFTLANGNHRPSCRHIWQAVLIEE